MQDDGHLSVPWRRTHPKAACLFAPAVLLAASPALAEVPMGITGATRTQLFAALLALLLLVLALSWKLLRNRRQLVAMRRALNAALAVRNPLLAMLPELVWFKDTDGVYISCNPTFGRLLNASVEQIVGKTDFDFHRTALARDWRRHDKAAVRNGAAVDSEEWLTFADNGHSALIQITRTPVYGDDGRLIGIMGLGRDITAQHKIKAELRQRESYQRALIDNFPFLVWLKDTDGRFLAVNAPFAQACGADDAESLVGKTDLDIWPRELALGYQTDDRAVMASRRKKEVVEQGEDDGRKIWLETYKAPVLDDDGRLLGTVGFSRDVSERTQAELELQRERDLFSAGPVVVFTWTAEEGWPVSHVSSNIEQVMGYTAEEMTAPDFRFVRIIHPDDSARIAREVERYLRQGIDRFEQSYRLSHKHDGYAWYRDFTRVTRDARGEVVSLRGYLVDQTEIKAMQLAVEEERRRLKYVIEGTNVGTWEWNVQTGETRLNERWAQVVGYRLNQLVPVSIDTWTRLAHPDDLERSGRLLQKHFAGELDCYECEVRMRHRDGHWVWVLDRGRVFEWDADGKPLWMAGTHQDITERKRTEARLRDSEHRLNAAVGQA
ncbi:MAG: PAS domain S-box protein [Chromatiaceae bacterium]|nr:PAS domain S-box protein [Gammaproteobacteria bacterium]MCP5317231.1 PAS domain S-box protein [Chromatiaceae bacterium]HOP15071.1 PAS domain S-box protein [Gammaproteobacteria bacterium]HPQ23354.1 PAS domain S-box protein [Gammaproteobacteria bacterium]